MKLTDKPKKTEFSIKPFKKFFITDHGHILNETSEFIIKNCNGKTAVSEICKKISKKYRQEDLRKIEKVVLKHLNNLEKEKLIQI